MFYVEITLKAEKFFVAGYRGGGIMDKTRAQILGENLERIRKEKGYSRKQLADIIGITEIAFGTYERGIRLAPLDKIFELAKFLNVSIIDLTGENPNVEKNIIFDYRYKRAVDITSTDIFFPTTELENGNISVYIPAKVIRNDDGALSFFADESGAVGYTVNFKDKKIFVDSVEKAEKSAIVNHMTFYQALKNLVENIMKT